MFTTQASFALSPYKVILCAMVQVLDQSLDTSEEQIIALTDHITNEVRTNLPERSLG